MTKWSDIWLFILEKHKFYEFFFCNFFYYFGFTEIVDWAVAQQRRKLREERCGKYGKSLKIFWTEISLLNFDIKWICELHLIQIVRNIRLDFKDLRVTRPFHQKSDFLAFSPFPRFSFNFSFAAQKFSVKSHYKGVIFAQHKIVFVLRQPTPKFFFQNWSQWKFFLKNTWKFNNLLNLTWKFKRKLALKLKTFESKVEFQRFLYKIQISHHNSENVRKVFSSVPQLTHTLTQKSVLSLLSVKLILILVFNFFIFNLSRIAVQLNNRIVR